ncbi:MAG: metallopeptidase TldD-related protein [Pseudomonadota bacterium]
MDPRLDELTDRLIAAARRAGADAADALAVAEESRSVTVRDKALESADRSEGLEIGLRVLIGQRQAAVAASDIKDATIEELALRAVAMAREAPEDPWCGLADPSLLATDMDVAALELDDPGEALTPAVLQERAHEAEDAARAVAGISQVDDASAGQGRARIHLQASNGFSGGYARSQSWLSCVAIAGTGLGMERDYAVEARCHAADLPEAHTVGTRAAARAVARTGARKPPTGAVPVVYDERLAGGLIGHLLSAINGTAIARRASWAADLCDSAVLPGNLGLLEEPRRVRAGASRPFDAEGLATERREIVADGILRTWTLDLATARQLGLQSTANASRAPSSAPRPAVSNIRLTGGHGGREDLLREMGRGLLITELLGASINPTTGDYSRGAAGFWVENGEIAYPVNECTVAGNLKPMLASLRAADDADPSRSRLVPSLLVDGLTVAGA